MASTCCAGVSEVKDFATCGAIFFACALSASSALAKSCLFCGSISLKRKIHEPHHVGFFRAWCLVGGKNLRGEGLVVCRLLRGEEAEGLAVKIEWCGLGVLVGLGEDLGRQPAQIQKSQRCCGLA